MSSPAAIASVTATLHRLMHQHLDGVDITTLPPDIARLEKPDEAPPQLNIYLYQMTMNAARRNDFSNFKPAESDATLNIAPVALNLYYLLTAYGPTKPGHTEWDSQRVLGMAMQVLNSQPLLDGEMIRAASTDTLTGAGLDEQAERVRFTPHALTLDDMYKIWSGFQKQYRLSVAYEASVVLIDSNLAPFRPRPVLRRGALDQGPRVTVGLPPQLQAVRFPVRANTPRGPFAPAAVEINTKSPFDRIILVGDDLDCEFASVQFRPVVGSGVIERPAFLTPDGILVELTPTRLPGNKLQQPPVVDATPIPFAPESQEPEPEWHAGFYTVSFVTAEPTNNPDKPTLSRMRSNALAVPVAPRAVDPKLEQRGTKLVLKCKVEPGVVARQRLTVIVQNQSASTIAAVPKGAHPDDPIHDVEFEITRGPNWKAREGIRLRVDEVENLSLIQKKSPDGKPLYPMFGTGPEVET